MPYVVTKERAMEVSDQWMENCTTEEVMDYLIYLLRETNGIEFTDAPQRQALIEELMKA